MKGFTLTLATGALAMAAGNLMAQSYTLDRYPPPLNANDSFVITLRHPVTVGRRVLQPGAYTVERLDIAASDLPILQIRGNSDMRVNIAAMISTSFSKFAPAEPGVSFYHIGNHYYFDRMWVQGLNYGYKFPLPKS